MLHIFIYLCSKLRHKQSSRTRDNVRELENRELDERTGSADSFQNEEISGENVSACSILILTVILEVVLKGEVA